MKKKNKILALMLVITFVFCMFPLSAMAAEADATISVSEVYAKAGEEVNLTVSMSNNPGVAVMVLDLNYDASKLDLISVADSALLSGFVGTDPKDSGLDKNPITLYWANDTAETNITKNGVLATLTFKVLDKAAVGDAIVGVTVKEAYDCDMIDVDFVTTAGAVKVYDKPITVSFRLIGDSKHSKGVEGHDEYVTWIKTVKYEVKPGSTVQDVFVKAIADYKLDQKGLDKGYVTAIKAPAVLGGYWLEALDNGPSSGWMYKLNGKDSSYTMGQQTLVNGDAIVFHYTDDYSAENFESGSQYLNRWLEAKDITPEEYIANQKPEVEVIDPSELPFTDVNVNNWFADEVAYVYSYGLMSGTSATTFAPDNNLTRAMMATILYRMEGAPKVTSANPFNDVEAGTWYTDAVIWAAEKGVVKGVGNGAFEPNTNINREQMACMMYRYAEYKGKDVSASDNLAAFSDAGKVSSWAQKEMKWAVGTDLIKGRTTTTLVPQGTATRAEAATVLMRFHKGIL